MSKERVHIFYAVDDNFAKFTVVSLTSLIKNASKDRFYDIKILNTGINEVTKKASYALCDDHFNVEFVDVASYLQSINDKLPIRDYYSKTTYYRMFIAEMFPELDKAIYIDSDTIVLGDISQLYDIELGEKYVGAVNEQAMIQTDGFGEYVEYCLGISRYNYFNAGLLLINCKKFREIGALDRFVELLSIYSFVVTQDEDYLNIICEDNVLFIHPGWNCEVFGNIPCKEEDIKILHYIMVSKPWHYADCRFSEQFWTYAKMTPFYDEIKSILDNYTDEERERDRISCDKLLETAVTEANREDNYLNMMAINSKKSPDRMRILQKIEKLEREGKFDQDVELDPPSKVLLPDDIDYLRKSAYKRLMSKFAFMVATRFVKKIIKKGQLIIKKINGIENFQNLEGGAVITCNHFNPFDSFAIQLVYLASQKKKKFYRVIKEGNYTSFPGFYGFLMRNCNTLPLSSNYETMKNFVKATDYLLKEGNYVLVYPEQSLWWNYRKPKPLKSGAFTMAAKNNVPVLPCFITMEDSKNVDENGFFVQEYTIHVSKPIYPDKNKSRKENVQDMLDQNYNEWKRIYEEFYNIPLEYLTDDTIS